MTLRDDLVSKMTLDEAMDTLAQVREDTGDEVAAAIHRQLDVLEGTIVLLSNTLQMLSLQVVNLRSEVNLLDTPLAPAAPAVAPPAQVQTTPRGAKVESSLPTERRLPGFCLHDDALIVDTTDGPVRVCPECDA